MRNSSARQLLIRQGKSGLSEQHLLEHRRLLTRSGGAPLVAVMQPAQHRNRDNPARLRRLDRS